MVSFFNYFRQSSLKAVDEAHGKIIWLFLATIITQIILYLPALSLPFAGFEDFQFLEKGWSGFMRNPNIPIQIDVGRPLGALILGLYAGIISSISDLNIVRGVSVAVLSVCQMSLIVFLIRSGAGSSLAFGMSTIVFATATITSTGQWAAAAQMPFAILFAFVSAELLYKGVTLQKNISSCSFKHYFKDRLIVASLISLIVSFLIYPTLALFFLVPFFVLALFCKNESFNDLFGHMLLVALAMVCMVYVLYFFGVKFAYFPIIRSIYPELLGNPIYNFDINADIFSKLFWMIIEVIPRFTEVFAIPKGGSTFISTILVLGGGAVSYRLFCSNEILRDPRGLKTLVLRTSLLLSLICVGNAHLVLSESAHLAPRIYAVGQTMLVFLFLASINEIGKILSSLHFRKIVLCVISVVAIVSVFSANRNIHTTALNQFMELRYMAAEIKRQYSPELNTIAVVQVPRRSMFMGDDIPGYNWTNSDVIGSMIPAMVSQALIQIGIADRYVAGLGADATYEESGRRKLRVVPIKPGELAYIEVDSVEIDQTRTIEIIDMRRLLVTKPRHAAEDSKRPAEPVEIVLMYSTAVQSVDNRYGPGSAVRPNSRNPDRFWETGPVPISLQFVFQDPKHVSSYSLGTGIGATGRMPVSWSIEGLSEDDVWQVLDRRKDESWTDGEVKRFPISNNANYRHYKMIFNETSDGVLRIYEIKLDYKQ